MAGPLQNITSLSPQEIHDANQFVYSIIVAQWHPDLTNKLKEGALNLLATCHVDKTNIHLIKVPGSFEIPLAAKWAFEFTGSDAVICLGCIIKGETQHDEIISNAITNEIIRLNQSTGNPVILGVLTVNNLEQAVERAGGAFGNKGEEAAVVAIKMLSLKKSMKNIINNGSIY